MILLDHHKQAKREIIARFTQLAEVADAVGMVTLARDIRTTRIPKLEAERFHLVVLGEFNHGKSTFVNALLGQDVLPTGITPTTAAINHVVYAQNPTAKVVLTSGESKYLDPGQLKEWVTVAGGHASEVAYVELGFPSDLLQNNVVLVDTPGVNDLNEQRAEVTYGYVPRADAVVFLLDAGQALKDSEREFLRSRVLESARDRLIFVLGKMDMLSPDERAAVVDYVKGGLAQITPDPVVFPLSAKDWGRSKDPNSGMPELMQYFERFLARDRAQVILDNAATDAARTASYLENNLGVRMVNMAKFYSSALLDRGGKHFRQSHAAFAFLLDYVPNWKRSYGPGGLIQYQSFIPEATAAGAFKEQLALAQRSGHPPYLAVFKRHRKDGFLMTHSVDGYSLALDFRITRRNRGEIWALAAKLDQIVLRAGGRFYFAKDSTLGAGAAAEYLGAEAVAEFMRLKGLCDPDGILETNLYRRLFGGRAASEPASTISTNR